ncbi:hypothetical protein L195_g011908 [Trifolium pratense]|uniref:Uncharacterized protein n=1 Tax=Trifolium pratense TaxID=57577 RepID=A0A2K3PIU5_TRIPR|nr:hypothetical protein L195_g011908 [Trifolium pratense]
MDQAKEKIQTNFNSLQKRTSPASHPLSPTWLAPPHSCQQNMVKPLYQDRSRLLFYPLSKGDILVVYLIGSWQIQPNKRDLWPRAGGYISSPVQESYVTLFIHSITFSLLYLSCSHSLSNFGIGAPAGTNPLRGSSARPVVNHLLNGLLAGHPPVLINS